MALFPMKQLVTITRTTGELDIYGKRTDKTETFTLKCRATEGTHLATARATGTPVICELKILFDKLAVLTYDDEIEYKNEAGTTYRGRPKSIKVQRDFGGKPILTEVLL